jgi:hypothetical protein
VNEWWPFFLPTENALGIAPAHLDDGGGHQLIVDDDVGFLQQPLRAQRQQVLGARPCPDQPDDARAVPSSAACWLSSASPRPSPCRRLHFG